MREPDAICDGGDLDCGSGLLLIIREAMAPLRKGDVLEVRSRESSVKEDLPAWCRMVGHALVAVTPAAGAYTHFRLAKQMGEAATASAAVNDDDAKLAQDVEQARRFQWSARVRWTAGMQATAFVRNHSFQIGQPASFDTRDAAPSAVEFLLAALGGCLAVGFQWRASRKGIEVRNLEVALRAGAENILVFLGVEESGHPGLKTIEGSLYIDADGDDAVLEELWKETVRRSPVAQSLVRNVGFELRLQRS